MLRSISPASLSLRGLIVRAILPLIASGCVLNPLPVEGLECPCAAGWVCIDEVCVPTPDGYVPPTDVPEDVPVLDDVPSDLDAELPDAPAPDDTGAEDAGTEDDAGAMDDAGEPEDAGEPDVP